MAWAKGRQAAIETAKAECLRRWPALRLKCKARYYNYKLEGYVVTKINSNWESGRGFVSGAKTAYEAWEECLNKLS